MEKSYKDLISSEVDRKNILNNKVVLNRVIEKTGIRGTLFENEYKFTIDQMAEIFDVGKRTIERVLSENYEELSSNGYEVLEGYRLQQFVSNINNSDTVRFGGIKHRRLGIFNTRSLLNIAMLLRENEIAKTIRSLLLDTAIQVFNEKTKGDRKHINLRDRGFIGGYYTERNYYKLLTDAIDNYVEDKPFKYSNIINLIYKSLFKSDAKEYRKILDLGRKSSVRLTLYTEILDVVSMFENGLADRIKKKSLEQNRKLTHNEVKLIVEEMENDPILVPAIEKSRIKMSSRDYSFRDAVHERIKDYIQAVPEEDYDKFIGEQSIEIDKQLEEFKEILKELK